MFEKKKKMLNKEKFRTGAVVTIKRKSVINKKTVAGQWWFHWNDTLVK